MTANRLGYVGALKEYDCRGQRARFEVMLYYADGGDALHRVTDESDERFRE